MSRRKARVLAFQTVYAKEASDIPLEDLFAFSWTNENSKSGDEYVFAKLLATGTIENQNQIDFLIKKYLSPSWDFSRINKVSLAILRISVYSLLFQKEIDSRVIIDEAIHIAKEYADLRAYKFINAMLDKINKEVRKKNEDEKK